MYEAKLTSKGQVTIPIEVRRYLRVTSGDKIVFTITDHGVVVDLPNRPLTIQERFANYDLSQADSSEAMEEINTGEEIGEEK